jgi:indole-3-glycerol phosphate synthase
MTKLEEICAKKREHVQFMRQQISLQTLEQQALRAEAPCGFLQALQQKTSQNKTALIAEIKKASPSKGLIRADFSPAKHAADYQAGGAACLSVLTDSPYFQGADCYLQQAKQTCNLPVLRKDFMVDTYQIIESRALGADCILLILAALDIHSAMHLEKTAHDWGMDVLVEVHTRSELEMALGYLTSPLIGINNRDLHSFNTSLSVTESLCSLIPAHYSIVCESGIRNSDDIERIRQSDVQCFLVGETLMRAKNITQATRQLLNLS